MMRKLILGACVAVVIVGVGLFWFREPILIMIGNWLVVETPIQEADLVVALSGERERQDEAVKLLKEGFAKWILFTANFRSHDYACLGIARQGIEPPIPAYRTYDEAVVTRKAMEQKGLRSAIIVTSPYHLRRTRLIFARVFDGKGTRLIFHPSENSSFSMNAWWRSYYGRKMILLEYLGLVYYGLTP